MQCPRCRAENRPDRRFCSACGAPLTIACGSCGFANASGERFCGGCGHPLPAGAEAKGEREGGTPPPLESERKYVTVLFADIRGSLEMLAHRDPEEAQAVLEPILERLISSVHRFGGTVNQVLGDGIMALFGAPVAYEDHALRGCSAALAMQAAVDTLPAGRERENRPRVQVRVGMNSGEVVVRAMIGDVQRDYSAVGETTHIASRVEQLTRPGSVTITESTRKLVEAFVNVVPLGRAQIKGLAAPLELYELISLRTTRSRLRSARPLSGFVGRALELEALAEGLQKARDGHGQFIAVVGEPGVGKSRLFLEFLPTATITPCLVLEAAAEAFGATSPFLPIVELLRGYFGLNRDDAPDVVRRVIEARLASLGDVVEDGGRLFSSFLSRDGGSAASASPSERQYRLVEAICALVLAESRRQPVVLIVEDLHWIDAPTQAILDALLGRLRDSRILLLASYRADYAHAWGHRSFRQIRLEPLTPSEVERLLDGLLGTDPSLDDVKTSVERHTDGNPLFVEETVRALVESGVLTGEAGRYRCEAGSSHASVPASVQAVLAARIDRLAAVEKRVLQCAAVIGRHVRHDVLATVAEVETGELERILQNLQGAEFLFETRRFPTPEYVFKHALTQEVAYGTLLQERRRGLHLRTLDALDAGGAADPEALAHHAVRAETWLRAVPHLRRAAARAIARSADAEAVTHLEQAVAALSHLDETEETLRQAVDVRLELRNALMPLADRARIFLALSEAEVLAKRLGDDQRLGWVSGYLTPYLWGIGQYARALETGRQAVAVAGKHGDLALEGIGNRYLGHVHYALGEYRAAVELLTQSLDALHENAMRQHFGLPFLSSIATESWLVSAMAELGRFDEAVARGRQAMASAEAAGHAYSVAAAACGLALAYVRRGDVENAVTVAERCLELCRTGDFSALLAWATAMLGYAYALAARPDAALLLLKEGADRMAAMQVKVTEAMVAGALGEANLLAGRVDAASELGARAVEVARSRRERACEAWGLRLLAEIATRATGRPGDAEKLFREAASIATELDMRPLEARCHEGLARVYGALGRSEEARTERALATAMFREMGMRSVGD